MMKRKKRNRILYIAIPFSLLVILITFITLFEYTAVAEIRESFSRVNKEETMAYGKLLFETRGCSNCHAIDPKQKSPGPNLSGISQRQSDEYIRQSIVSPGAVIVEGYEDITMPSFSGILDQSQVDALVEYISILK